MIDDKQFFISNRYRSFRDWATLTLNTGYTLVYQPKLHVSHNADGSAVLLGHAWQVEDSLPSPSEIIEHLEPNLTAEQVMEIEKTWCGRYIIIYDGLILTDACSMLGVYYADDMITSSLHVLCQLRGIPPQWPDIRLGLSPNFIPGPLTGYEGVSKLLPSQILHYPTLDVKTRPLLPDSSMEHLSEEERIKAFSQAFVTSLQNMRIQFPAHRIMVALTGGKDSRLLMALMEKARLAYGTFTAWHDRITEGDKDIPPQLARTVQRTHTMIMRQPYSPQAHSDYDTHTAGYAKDQDQNFWAYGQYSQLLADHPQVLILRSSIWECTDDHYRHFTDPLDLYRQFPYALKNDTIHQSFELWKQIVADDPHNRDINIWTRLFWDQREGCWLSALEQGYDLMDGLTSIQPCNSRRLLSLLMGFDQAERFRKIHEDKIMAHVCEPLTHIVYDRNYNGYSLKPERDLWHQTIYCVKYKSIFLEQFTRRCARFALRKLHLTR